MKKLIAVAVFLAASVCNALQQSQPQLQPSSDVEKAELLQKCETMRQVLMRSVLRIDHLEASVDEAYKGIKALASYVVANVPQQTVPAVQGSDERIASLEAHNKMLHNTIGILCAAATASQSVEENPQQKENPLKRKSPEAVPSDSEESITQGYSNSQIMFKRNNEILAALKTDGPLTGWALEQKTALARGTINIYLHRLKKQGLVARCFHGDEYAWSLAPSTQQTIAFTDASTDSPPSISPATISDSTEESSPFTPFGQLASPIDNATPAFDWNLVNNA